MQGVTMLDETFAQYSSLMLQEKEYGFAQMRKFLIRARPLFEQAAASWWRRCLWR